MCVKAVNTCSFVFDYVRDRYKSHEMCNKAVDDDADALEFVPNQYKTHQLSSKAVDDYANTLEFLPDRYKTQEMCDKIVEDFLPALRFVCDWFVTSEIIKKLSAALYPDDGLLFFDEGSGNVILCCNEIGILSVNPNNINVDDTNYGEDDPDTIILVRLLAWYSTFEKRKELKKRKSEELMSIAWHPRRWWNFCVSEDEKKETILIFTV